MGFSRDIFISYSHNDNDVPFEGQDGWVSNFSKCLKLRLNQLTPGMTGIWRDPKLTRTYDFPDALKKQLQNSAALVVIVSPSYMESEWCTIERREFCSSAKNKVGMEGKRPIFKVVKLPPEKTLPSELQDILGWQFYNEDPETGRYREIDPFLSKETYPKWFPILEDLAQEIKDILNNDPGKKSPEGPVIYLAKTTLDLREQYDSIRRDLRRNGYTVLPDCELPGVESELKSVIEDQLKKSDLSVHLIGQSYGMVPEGSNESVIALQNELAIARGESDFRRLIWLAPDQHPDDPRQIEYLQSLREDSRMNENADILEHQSLEKLKEIVYERLKSLQSKGESSTCDETKRVYVMCDQNDINEASQIADYLYKNNLEPELPVFEGDEKDRRLLHEDYLRECDAFVMYYGHAHELWLRRMRNDLLKVMGQGRCKPILANAIYVGPPGTPQKENLRIRELTIRQTEHLDPTSLKPFLEQVHRKHQTG